MIQIANEAEAFAAIASLILTVDKVGTEAEQLYLFHRIRAMSPFEGMTESEFFTLFSEVNAKLFKSEGGFYQLLTKPGISNFCQGIRQGLNREMRMKAFLMACELALVDGLVTIEMSLLYRLGEGLELSTAEVTSILRRYQEVVL